MRLVSLGRIFSANKQSQWMNSYAQVPRAILLEDVIRIYFATRGLPDEAGQYTSRVGYVDVDKCLPTKIVSIAEHPVLDVGESGSFDEFGVMPGEISQIGSELRMLYTGWARPPGMPYQTWIGEARSDLRGSHFERVSQYPVLGATPEESILCNGPFTISHRGSDHMFYSSGLRWIDSQPSPECQYVIMHAQCSPGGEWLRDGVGSIPILHEMECQNAPTVHYKDGRFHMLFCHRHALDFRNPERGYRLGYAWSDDLVCWHRNDEKLVLSGMRSHWDNEMQCYPGFFRIRNEVFVLYCGNYFGKSGFGIATVD
jgi:hypothetical protein